MAVALIAIAMSLYHMHAAAFGPPEALIFRGTHLLFAVTLVFLLYPTRPGGRMAWRALDAVLMLAGWGIVLHIFLNYQYYTNRIIYIDELTFQDRFWALAAILVVLEGTRRVLGWALPITVIVFLAYAASTQVTFPVLMEQVYLSTEGIFGSTLGVSASYVMMFVLFGAFMEKSGTGQLFMDFSMSITGRYAGGPGKVAVVSSSLFGTVSGSAVANVMVDGPITIPADEAHRLSPAVRRGGRGGRLHRRAADAADHGSGGIRDGGIPRRALRADHHLGDPARVSLLPRGVRRGPFRGQAPQPCRRARFRAAALWRRDDGARPPVSADRARAVRLDPGLFRAAVCAGGRAFPACRSRC